MLSQPLLAPLLAAALLGGPAQVMAFEAMDCVGTEYCTAEGCSPSFLVYTIAFDWPAQEAILGVSGDAIRFVMASNDTNADGAAGALTYINSADAGLILAFETTEIEMTYASGNGAAHRATCAAREAA